MRRVGYICAGALFVLFLALSVNLVKIEARETSDTEIKNEIKRLNQDSDNPNKEKIEYRLYLELPKFERLPTTGPAKKQIQRMPRMDSGNKRPHVTPCR